MGTHPGKTHPRPPDEGPIAFMKSHIEMWERRNNAMRLFFLFLEARGAQNIYTNSRSTAIGRLLLVNNSPVALKGNYL